MSSFFKKKKNLVLLFLEKRKEKVYHFGFFLLPVASQANVTYLLHNLKALRRRQRVPGQSKRNHVQVIRLQ